ncbi:MAG: cytochrome c maturation protein CcmE [Gemmatimonadaceae bacterium]
MPEKGARKRRAVAVGALVAVAGAFAYLLIGGIGENLVYFLSPGELLARGTAAYDRPVRLGGQVVPGSVQWDADRLELRFGVTDGTQQISVRSKGAPPQMFRDGIGVVVEGHYRRGGEFESHNLMVKHSNEYRAPKPGEQPHELYKTLIRGNRP